VVSQLLSSLIRWPEGLGSRLNGGTKMSPGTGTHTSTIDESEVFDRIRAQWLSSLIHDLSSPLFALRGYVRLTLEEREGTLPTPYRRYLAAALENINKLVTLTQELSDGPDRAGYEFDIVDFRDLMRQVIEAASLQKDVRIKEVSGDSLLTVCDSRKLVPVLRSFLSSAVEFTGAGGKIEIHLREENGNIVVRFAATRGLQPLRTSPPDLSAACKLWRLHGGSGFVQTQSDDGYSVTCELPLIRQSECL
jgi:signal transduction histidine kinase